MCGIQSKTLVFFCRVSRATLCNLHAEKLSYLSLHASHATWCLILTIANQTVVLNGATELELEDEVDLETFLQ